MGNIKIKKAEEIKLEKEINELKKAIEKQEKNLKELADDLKMANLFDDTEEIELLKSMRDDILDKIANFEKELAGKEEEYEAL